MIRKTARNRRSGYSQLLCDALLIHSHLRKALCSCSEQRLQVIYDAISCTLCLLNVFLRTLDFIILKMILLKDTNKFITLLTFGLHTIISTNIYAQVHVIGWQTFENATPGNNNSGINDTSPDTNSTYDATPNGSIEGSLYLTGSIGANASNFGYDGMGQDARNEFLNGTTFGNDLLITDYTLADGSPGQRIGPYLNPYPNGEENDGASSWKFSQTNGDFQLYGDFSITNHSDYHFRLEYVHFDARGMVNTTYSPRTLTLKYLATPGELINASTGTEVSDQRVFYSNTWSARGVEHVSQSLAAVVNSALRIPPGEKASFRFVWSDAAGNGHAQIDNLAFSGTFLDADNNYAAIDPTAVEPPANQNTNIIVLIPDDQRWDATSFMQARMGSLGRTARFPWLATPSNQTPNIDRLSNEGTHFDNAFSVYSLCSPARATMLTGQHAHTHGITNNDTELPLDTVTYASLLQDAGYTTGYFGKWHMATQAARPGFTEAATYHGQGTYYSTAFYDEAGNGLFNTSASDWVDDISTREALSFISAQNSANNPFMLVLGFKTPHSPRDPPNRSADLFSNNSPTSVPNLNTPPPFAPNANSGTELADLRNYMRTVVGIDQNVGQILDLLDSLNIADNTAVIFISDQGYFRGEHRLGDKRAAYEESIRIPFMIRYPALQNSAAVISKIALNLDLAPTILDIAGVDIPDTMQGKSLLPFISGQNPSDWRSSFLFSYNHDPEFPVATVRPYLAIRHEDGSKLVNYAEDSSWNELYETDTDDDPYEISNQYSSTEHSSIRENLDSLLAKKTKELGFLKVSSSNIKQSGGSLTIQSGDSSHFKLEQSSDMNSWTGVGVFEGNGETQTLSLIHTDPSSSVTVVGDSADYTLTEGPPLEIVTGLDALNSGAFSPGGGCDAVFNFALPALPANQQLAKAQLEVSTKRQYAMWDSDLWTLGIRDNSNPVLEFSESPSGDPQVIKLQDAFLTDLDGGIVDGSFIVTRVSSSPASALTQYLQDYYDDNPSYSGGKFLFLRVNPSLDVGVNNQRYMIYSAQTSDSALRPQLKLYYKTESVNPDRTFYRVRYGND